MDSNLCNQYLIGVIRDFWTFSEISQRNDALNYVEFRAAMQLMGFMASLALPNCLIVTGITFNTNILHFTTRLSNPNPDIEKIDITNLED